MYTSRNDLVVVYYEFKVLIPLFQKHAALAIRNLVSRSADLQPEFLKLGVEELLKLALKIHGKKCEDHVKSALRDLGCDVEFRELWTGKGGALN